ncbi:MAG: 2OG-Fe(II) oxygenase family protein [Myxococcota bacterium]
MPTVPCIDIEPLTTAPGSARAVAVERRIADAARQWGFFQIVNHPISGRLIARTWEQTRAFFGLPRQAKLAVSRTKTNSRGYYDRELTKRARDLKEVFDFAHLPYPELPDDHPRNHAPVDGHNQWPRQLPAFRSTMMEYLASCEQLGAVLLGAFCAGMDIPRETLDDDFGPENTTFIRLNYYPLTDPLDRREAAAVTALGDMALHHHTDSGALTVLLQDDCGGLQVLANNQWIDVSPINGALVINTGDMMQVWSNDEYRAALHRVLPQTDRERFSIPCFINPSYATNYAPLNGDDRPPRYRSINWGEFRRGRADGDYADYGEEIQISDFRL